MAFLEQSNHHVLVCGMFLNNNQVVRSVFAVLAAKYLVMNFYAFVFFSIAT
jgi:hypothetical protein